jgi:iron complex outermembrane receptor protein
MALHQRFCTASFKAMLLISGAALSASVAHAQADSAEAPAGRAELSAADIVVTGSRVTTGANSPIPLTVASVEQLQSVQPTSLSDQVNILPQLQGSQTQSTSGTGIRNGSAAYLTLRNAGDNHTLVLWDGQRVQPTTSQESHASDVDINVIPQMLIKRVDIVTGGVSAVYGSDAVTGVVNFVTDTNFNGFKAQASRGISTYGDGAQWNAGAAFGTRFLDGKAHFEVSYEHRDDAGILDHMARDYAARALGSAGNGTTIPFTRAANLRSSNQSFNGLITNGTLSGLQFAQNGVLAPFQAGTATGVTNQQIGGDGAWNNLSSLKSSMKFDQVFARFDYDFSETLKFYTQFAGTIVSNANISSVSNITLKIANSNPFVKALAAGNPTYAATINALSPTGNFGFTKALDEIPQEIDTRTKFYMAVAGLSGKVGTFDWNVNYQHSDSKVRVRNVGNIDLAHLYAAADAVTSGGSTVCGASLTNAAYANCVPVNLFGPTSMSVQARQYVTGVTGSDSDSVFNDVSGSVTGTPFETWAGPVKMALSGEWRKVVYQLASLSTPGDLIDCTGISTLNCTQGTTTRWLNNTLYNRSPVHQEVAEAAYEVDVPLIRDKPFFQSFNVNGAARYTHYNSSGGVWTWKVGADWHMNDDITLRGTLSRDIRAPNLNELYNPDQPNNSAQRFDLHTNTQKIGLVITQSNPNLVPEKASTYTLGVVLRPSFLPRFTFSADYYHIKINDAIIAISGVSTQVQQACEASGGASPLCALMIRPLAFSDTTSANFPTAFLSRFLNIASIKTQGVDFEAGYQTNLFQRPLALRALVAWQPQLVYDSGPSGAADIAGTAGGQIGYGNSSASPRWKATGIFSYKPTDNFTVTVLERWRSQMYPNANRSLIYVQNKIPAIAYTNLNLAWNVPHANGNFEFYVNVQNLFNKFLPDVAPVTGDDPYGRYFTAGVRMKF